MNPAAPAPQGRRTSPLVVLVHTATFKQARQVVPAVIPILAATGFGGGTTMLISLVVGVTLLSLLTAALSWWRFSYLDGPTAVVVTRGLVSRSVRTVPNDRIRGVEVEAPVLHRVFGLVRVRIDAAAGAAGENEEVVVDGVPRAEGDRLRAAVLTHRATAPEAAEEEPVEEEFGRFDNRWLLYAPLVGSYLAVPLAAVGALFRLVDELPRQFQPDLEGPDVSDGRAAALLVVAALLLLVLGAVVGAAIVNWRFRLTRRGGSLVAVRGLLTRRHTELEIDRIRGWTLSEGLGMRWVRAARLSALVTGLGDATRRGQLLPLGPRTEAVTLGRRLVTDPAELIGHPPAARRRRILRATAAGVLVTLAGAVTSAAFGWWWLLAAGIALTVLAVPVGLGRYAALGHATGPDAFTVRSGWLVREQAVLQRRAVVGWQVRQSFFQRRADLATVIACVGAGQGGYASTDMAAGEVAAFAAAASEPWAATLSAR
ncbi:PH domain-containing protein [Blastococcus sp. PRF04-17]|uniref:PH domain-containing protein n=1 Tax=Blastococcus sp. PRF04-17 TaxID=2933797 RepID=UPI001FF6D6F3|nr:PH domain-containing protein [Blastococcus sp. PRF04-17]UOY00370.1 PH domain-containing protein [Blastococcus sp. PRF04-17]